MTEAALPREAVRTRWRDLVEIAKPRITAMVILTTALGLGLAPRSVSRPRAIVLLTATAVLVASANMLNSWLEREIDARMIRTRGRPIPAGRVDPWVALALGIVLGAFAVPALALAVNPTAALLGATAHAVYVLVYTPLKRFTPRALEIGAIPGAIPPLMGWTAATGTPDPPAWILFAILYFWQLPHFIAIAVYLQEDYRRGGLMVLPVARGEATARRWLLAYTFALVVASLSAFFWSLAGQSYLVVAAASGAGFLLLAILGLRPGGGAWARRTMLYSLVYLVALSAALVADAR